MRLTELHPRFLGAGGEGISNTDGSPAPKRTGVGLRFDCPCGCKGFIYVDFDKPLDGGPPLRENERHRWTRTGDTFETLTLTPSILCHNAGSGDPCKGWHGFVTNGEVTSC